MSYDDVFLVSYIPLLRDTSLFKEVKSPEHFEEILKKIGFDSTNNEAIGCIWYVNDGEFFPVIVLENADEIASHLIEWSDNQPEKWFKVHYAKDKFKYAMALSPNVDESINRFKINHQLRTGYPVPKKTKFQVLFKYIHFTSALREIDFKQSKMKVKFLDSKYVNKENFDPSCVENAIEIGEFEFVNNSKFAKQILEKSE